MEKIKRYLVSVGVMVLMLFTACQKADMPSTQEGSYTVQAAQSFGEITSFGDNPGKLKMFLDVPSNAPANAPIVVVMHGCQQTADNYRRDTQWNILAEKYKFYVIWPEQQLEDKTARTGNPYKCFNWGGYYGENKARGKGENQSVISMVNYVKSKYSVNDRKVYITGLSAGAAATNLLLATWPEVFAGGAPMAGIPYNCAHDVSESNVQAGADCMGVDINTFQPLTGAGCESGEACMKASRKVSAQQWGDWVREAYPGYSGPYPRVIVWQGMKDQYVDDDNAFEIVKQWTNVNGIDQNADNNSSKLKAGNTKHNYYEYTNSTGKALVAMVEIPEMKHGIAIDPGTGEDQGGEAFSAVMGMVKFAFDIDLYSSYYTAKWWGLLDWQNNPDEPIDPIDPIDPVDPAEILVQINSPLNGAQLTAGNVTVQIRAQYEEDIASVELWQGELKKADTTRISGTSKDGVYSATIALSAGNYAFKAKAKGVDGEEKFSSIIAVVVTEQSTGEVFPAVEWQKVTGSFNQLNMYIHVPKDMPKNQVKPLLVVMHGCMQTAADFEYDAQWNKLADTYKFYIIHAENPSGVGYNQCFDWYSDTVNKGQGAAAGIMSMISKMKADYKVDSSKVFATGISAGAALSVILLANYPDQFAAGGLMAGIPFKGYVGSAFSCLSYIQNGTNKTPTQWAALMPKNPGVYPKIIEFHGTADKYVNYSFQNELMEQWTAVQQADQNADVTSTLKGHVYKEYHDNSGKVLVATVTLDGMAHGITVDPNGTGEDKGGQVCKVSGPTTCFSFDEKLHSSYYAAKFFGLTTPVVVDLPPAIEITSPANGTTLSGVVTVSANATDDKGVAKVMFYIDNNLVAEDTASPYTYSWNLANYTNGTHSVKAVAVDTIGQSSLPSTISVTGGEKQDLEKPTINVTAPVNGQSISGTSVTLMANAFDNIGVARVEFFLNNVKVGEDLSAPYEVSASIVEGSYAVKAIAYDAAGNFSIDDDTSFVVATFQCREFTASNVEHKAAGRAVSSFPYGENTVEYATTVGAGDDLGLMGGTYFSTTTTVAETKSGYFVKGNCPADPDNDLSAPSVNITAPSNNAQVGAGNVTISASATDNIGVVKVEFYVGSDKVGESTSAPYSVTWNAAVGTYELTAKAYDAKGNVGTSAVVNVVVSSGGFVCKTYTAKNTEHVAAGRAEVFTQFYVKYAKTIGSGESLGQLGSSWYSATTSVKETASGYFEKGSCN